MGWYDKEIAALIKAGRFRTPMMAKPRLIDMASNDYLCLAHKRKLLRRAYERVADFAWHAPKSSLFLGGYHPIHEMFENELALANGFEAATLFGSGFLANMGLIEALVRRGDTLFIDESYHASGMLATKTVQGNVVPFLHNNPEDLRQKIAKNPTKKRKILAVEGIYSMEGDLVLRDFFTIAEEEDMLMIVDEAHSNGVVGNRLLGIFDHYNITPTPRHVKMGTLGKAYGSYGAYVLASEEVITFLHNRSKSLIYATAPSYFDITLAHEGFRYVAKKRTKLIKRLNALRDEVQKARWPRPQGAIVPIPMPDIPSMMGLKEDLEAAGFSAGAIRPPTTKRPMLRIILRTCISPKSYRLLFEMIAKVCHG